jgi:leucyl aminopeptidase
LEDIGIWNNIETIENNLAKMKTKKEKTTALKQQINMCREIVQVPSEDKYPTGYYERLTFQLISINFLSAVECQIASPFH